jgi:hypothetical protein
MVVFMNNPPAFPHTVEYKGSDCGGIVPHGGMTLRDYFAAKALQGLMHNYHPCDFLEHKGWLEDISMASYQMADSMLKAREA